MYAYIGIFSLPEVVGARIRLCWALCMLFIVKLHVLSVSLRFKKVWLKNSDLGFKFLINEIFEINFWK
jgi:hypothetical protein